MKTTTLILLSLAALAAPAPAQNPLTLVGQYAGEGYNNYFGGGMTCGDFNNDGYEEFLIGSAGWNYNYTGKNYIYFGSTEFPTLPGWTVQGNEPQEAYDIEDKNVGDINSDGIDDFSIVAGISGGIALTGRMDIYFGGAPLDTIPDWTLHADRPGWAAWSIDSCGDVNGDGGNDFIASLKTVYGSPDCLAVYIFWGGIALDTIPDWQVSPISDNFWVNGLGDVNGDGFHDVMIREHSSSEPIPARIFFGGSPMDTVADVVFDDGYAFQGRGAGVGDVNADGYADVILHWKFPDSLYAHDVVFYGGPDMDTEPDMFLRQWNGGLTMSTIAMSCGDFNGDGISDIINTSGFAYYTFAVSIHLGGPNFNPTPDAYVTGYAPNQYGYRLASGDINGDGRDELLVGELDDSFPDGTVYLYEGPETWIDYGVGSADLETLQRTPGWFQLDQNYPNPFNFTTSIHFELGKLSTVNLNVYDLRGDKVKSLLTAKEMAPGGYNVSWTGRDENNQAAASGIYLMQLQVDQYRQVRKIALLR